MPYSELLLVALAGLIVRQEEWGAVLFEVASVPTVGLSSHLWRGQRLRRVELELLYL